MPAESHDQSCDTVNGSRVRLPQLPVREPGVGGHLCDDAEITASYEIQLTDPLPSGLIPVAPCAPTSGWISVVSAPRRIHGDGMGGGGGGCAGRQRGKPASRQTEAVSRRGCDFQCAAWIALMKNKTGSSSIPAHGGQTSAERTDVCHHPRPH